MSDTREKELLRQVAERDAQVINLKEQLAQARLENELLKQKLDALAKRIFEKKSEQLSPDQLQLLFQELEAPGPGQGKGYGPQSSEEESARSQKTSVAARPRDRAPRVPDHLPVVEEVIVPEVVKGCPEAWRQIGEEVSERLDYEPARFLRHRTVRPIGRIPPAIPARSWAISSKRPPAGTSHLIAY